MGDAEAVAYLHARGIDRETALTFRVGVVRDPLPGHERFRGFMAIPYLAFGNQCKQLRFRCMQDHDHRSFGHGKYMSVAHDPTRVFNVRAVTEARFTIHIAEGELDAMILNKVGLPAVAIPGANAWQYHHRDVFAGFNRVWVWGDPDDAGADFVNKVSKSLNKARGVRLKGGDVNDLYLAGGAEALHALIREDGV